MKEFARGIPWFTQVVLVAAFVVGAQGRKSSHHVMRPVVTIHIDGDGVGTDRRRHEHPLSSRILEHDDHFGTDPATDFIHAHAGSLVLTLPVQSGDAIEYECEQLTHLYHPEFIQSDGATTVRGTERCQYSCRERGTNHSPGVLTTCSNVLHAALTLDGVEHFLTPGSHMDHPTENNHDAMAHVLTPSTRDARKKKCNHDPATHFDPQDTTVDADAPQDGHDHVADGQRIRREDKPVKIIPLEVIGDVAFSQFHPNPKEMAQFYLAGSHVLFASKQFDSEIRLSIKKMTLYTPQTAGRVPEDLIPYAAIVNPEGQYTGVDAEAYLDHLGYYHKAQTLRTATVVGLSGHDLDQDNNDQLSTAGIATVQTLCRSVAASVSEGFYHLRNGAKYDAAKQKEMYQTIGHEIGHNFGGRHGCTRQPCQTKVMNYGSWNKFTGWEDGGFWSNANVRRINNYLRNYPFGTCDNTGSPILEERTADGWSDCINGYEYRTDRCYGKGNEGLCTIANQGASCRTCDTKAPCPTPDSVCAGIYGAGAFSYNDKTNTCAKHQCVTADYYFTREKQAAPEGMLCPGGQGSPRRYFCRKVNEEIGCYPIPAPKLPILPDETPPDTSNGDGDGTGVTDDDGDDTGSTDGDGDGTGGADGYGNGTSIKDGNGDGNGAIAIASVGVAQYIMVGIVCLLVL